MAVQDSETRGPGALARWTAVRDRVATGGRVLFAEQWDAYLAACATRGPTEPPPAAWEPLPELLSGSNVSRFAAELGLASYAELHRFSVECRGEFWSRVLDRLGIVLESPPTTAVDLSGGPLAPRWLPGATLCCVDSCFTTDPSRVAVVSGHESGCGLRQVTYGELEAAVNRFARGLQQRGLGPGDGVALYMPMTVESVVAYLGTVRAGAHVISIADSFSPAEVRRRLELGGARLMVTVARLVRGGKTIPLYERALAAGPPGVVVIPPDDGEHPTLRGGDMLWDELLAADGTWSPQPREPYDLVNVLFSSGTTGEPKAIPWTHLTPIKCAMDGHFHQDIRPSDVVAWPTNLGWMMGPWLVFASLINNATMALYEGRPGDPGFTRFVADVGVTVLGVVPSLVRAWREGGACDGADWSRIRVFSSTGEPSTAEDYLWLMSLARYRAPVIEYCGGTEIGGGYVTGAVVQPAAPATFTTAALGIDLVVLDATGRPVSTGCTGEVFLVPPSVGLSQSLLNRDHEEVYHAGCPAGPSGELLRRHGDQMTALEGGHLRAQGRADDTMNLGGIKTSSRELEQVAEGHPLVFECAAVAARAPEGGGDRLVYFVVPTREADATALRADLGKRLAAELNPLFKIHDLILTDTLPRTASGKVMRRTLRDRYAHARADSP